MYDLNAMFCKHIKMKEIIFLTQCPLIKFPKNYEAFIYNIYAPQVFGGQLRCGKAKSNGKKFP